MALGKPAVGNFRGGGTLKPGEIREMEGILQQIRERLRIAEGQIGTTTLQTGQNTLLAGQSNASLSALQSQLTALQAQLAALTADVFAPDDEQMVVSAEVFGGHHTSAQSHGASPAVLPSDTEILLAGRVFAPHIPLTADTPANDADALTAVRVFAANPPQAPSLDQEASTILAGQIFGD